MAPRLVPARWQPPLPLDRLILREAPGADAVEADAVFVGAGPAGLAGALELARLSREAGVDRTIAVLEKAESLGEHSLSGAVVNPRAFRELFPGMPEDEFPLRAPVARETVYCLSATGSYAIPTPPTMRNHGNRVASLCEIVRWLGAKAEEAGINVFTGFPGDALLADEAGRVVGVRTAPSGLDRSGSPGSGYQPPTDVAAKVVALSEGTRGTLAQAWLAREGIGSANPQIYALGVKEIWETKRPLDRVIHTMGWPLPGDAFGGSFAYPLEPHVVALGLVVGLDYRRASLDVHLLLQRLKTHPLFRPLLEGGELVEWGAKTIPEGGFHALPERASGDGVVLLGDSCGLVEVASLKGIHYAMTSGILAARAIHEALLAGDVSAGRLAAYDRALRASFVVSDLRERRNLRLAFKKGFWMGGLRAGIETLTRGAFPGGRIASPADAEEPKEPAPADPFVPDGTLTFRKLDAVFRSGNQTRDDVPSHLVVGEDVPPEVADLYAAMCPAGVYEREGDRLVVNPPNCVDCKATDVLGPRWTPREGGSGPRYRRM